MKNKIKGAILENLHIEHNGYSGLNKVAKKIENLFKQKWDKKETKILLVYGTKSMNISLGEEFLKIFGLKNHRQVITVMIKVKKGMIQIEKIK